MMVAGKINDPLIIMRVEYLSRARRSRPAAVPPSTAPAAITLFGAGADSGGHRCGSRLKARHDLVAEERERAHLVRVAE